LSPSNLAFVGECERLHQGWCKVYFRGLVENGSI
jgi:hypothetical protein